MLKEELTELELVKELPRRILIGKKFVLVRQLTFNEYLELMAKIAVVYPKHLKSFAILLTNIKNEPHTSKEKFIKDLQNAMLIQSFRRDILQILNWLFPIVGKKWFSKKSYLEKHITPFQILCLVEAMWEMNFDMLKKKIQEVGEKMNLISPQKIQLSPSPDTSKKPMDGAKNNSFKPRYPKLSPISAEKTETVEMGLGRQ